ncbi:MAG: fumarate hydratase [Clostridiales bacterium]|jgi:fumarate hydratase subunit alpha|nr:fumarate hydratase [Clostridia bacterium]NLD02679.1 fumarate hydratase [Clostridiales bacterium]
MRTIQSSLLTQAVAELFIECSYVIGDDVRAAIDEAKASEPSPIGRNTLEQISENYRIAGAERIAICQDTGLSVIFAQVGQDAHIEGLPFEEAIQQGVREAYLQGYLRKSIVSDPVFDRVNTKDNTPAVIHTRIVPGDRVKLTAVAKGFGSENMSALKMLVPADGVQGIKQFVLDTVEKAGPNPCPPIIIGMGIGGSFESAAIMAKQATALPLSRSNPDPRYKALEDGLLRAVNALGIGPGGTGGVTTALKVHILQAPTHIAGLPVAINICCHAARHASVTL